MTNQAGRIVVVTGGASGIGAASAEVLARDGWRVVVAGHDMARAQLVADRIKGVAWHIDVASDDSVAAAARDIEAELGPVYGLVNSAGILQKPLTPHQLPMEEWDRIQAVNFRGAYITSLAFARAMLERRSGSIVNISSISGSRSMPLHSYAPAKAALISMTQCLAAEWGPASLRVNSVAPGYTLTPALAGAIERGERQVGGATSNSPLGQLVRPEQVGEAVAFLLSDRASAITGVDLPVDCGWLVGTGWDMYGGLRAAPA
ncbi:MAG: NAD(P)-dependent dehydrogenase (short-subunit alcohol dehydrogenase family) [Janthinobacterium sp.]|jgi:NAD(P)-dependent dehydrogenase (short-subunit alcohol dehydrogenase family)